MSTMIFYMWAAFPGRLPRQPRDADWTDVANPLTWSSTIYAQMTFVPAQSPVTEGYIDNGYLTVPQYAIPNYSDTYNVAVLHGGQSSTITVDSEFFHPDAVPGVSMQGIQLDSPWNSIKDIEVTSISSAALDVSGFVDTVINPPNDNNAREVTIDYAKRGAVTLGDGNDRVAISVAANEYTWSSHFDIALGDGRDSVYISPAPTPITGDFSAPTGWTFNTEPQLTTADITLGNGSDGVGLNEVSGAIHVGNGNDSIALIDGNTTVWLGSGNDEVYIAAKNIGATSPYSWPRDTEPSSSFIHVGGGHVDILVAEVDGTPAPKTTLNFIRWETGGSTLATADTITCGHFDPTSSVFVEGDLTALAIDLSGYSPGSSASLEAASPGGAMLLQIHDGTTGGVDALALHGASVASVASLHLRFN